MQVTLGTWNFKYYRTDARSHCYRKSQVTLNVGNIQLSAQMLMFYHQVLTLTLATGNVTITADAGYKS